MMKYLAALALSLSLISTLSLAAPSNREGAGSSGNTYWNKYAVGAKQQKVSQSELPYHDQHGYASWNSANLGEIEMKHALDPADFDTPYTRQYAPMTVNETETRKYKKKEVIGILKTKYEMNPTTIGSHMKRIFENREVWDKEPEQIASEIHDVYKVNHDTWSQNQGKN